jgi:hypothetical protein
MKESTFLPTLIMTSLFTLHLYGQNHTVNNQGIHIIKEETFRLRIGGGVAMTSAATHLKSQLSAYGFGDKYNASYDWIYSGGNDYYPQSTTIPLVAELTLEKKIVGQAWVGLSIGIDPTTSIKGYDRFGTDHSFWQGTFSVGRFLTMKHKSWFLSPQFSFDKSSGKIGFFGGPTFEFNKLDVHNETQSHVITKKIKTGAVVGVRAIITRGLEWFASYRFSAGMPYGQVTNSYKDGDRNITTVLPAGRINLNHFRTGLAWRIAW